MENGKYDYEVEFTTEEFIYSVKLGDYSDYFVPKPLRDLINVILYDQNSSIRLIEFETNDQSTFNVYADPFDLKNLYDEFEIEIEMIE